MIARGLIGKNSFCIALIATCVVIFVSCRDELSNNTKTEVISTKKENEEIDSPFTPMTPCFDEKLKDSTIGFGCAGGFIYKKVKKGVLTIDIDLGSIHLDSTCQDFAVNTDSGVDVNLELFRTTKPHKDSVRSISYCNCMINLNEESRIKTMAVAGNILAKKDGDMVYVNAYNLIFLHPLTKDTLIIKEEVFSNINTNWMPG